MVEGRFGENDSWKLAWGNKKAKSGRVFSFKEACKGAGEEKRESETSPQRLVFQNGGKPERGGNQQVSGTGPATRQHAIVLPYCDKLKSSRLSLIKGKHSNE